MPDENDIVYETHGFDLVGALRAFVEHIITLFKGDELSSGSFLNSLTEGIVYWWNIYSIVAILISLVLLAGFIYAKIRYSQLAEFVVEQLEHTEHEWAHVNGGRQTENSRWNDVQTHIGSDNPNDWRLAIIEADIMLEDTLEKNGFVGGTIGEKLKGASSSTFHSVQDAWDAHKVRNEIAHAGSDFVLTKRMATETIVKYERVFKEFSAI